MNKKERQRQFKRMYAAEIRPMIDPLFYGAGDIEKPALEEMVELACHVAWGEGRSVGLRCALDTLRT